MSCDASTFRQEMVFVVFQRPPGLTCGKKGKHHFFRHCVGGLASMSNDTGFMVVAMACALEGGRIHLNNDTLLTPSHRIVYRSKSEDMERWRAKTLQEFISTLCYAPNAAEL